MKRTAEENLTAGAKTFAERRETYGDSYTRFGHVMAGLFPDGLHIETGDVDSFNRLGVFVQIVSKACRYADSLTEGGHEDSAHDTMVYGAILEELTKEQSRPGMLRILNDEWVDKRNVASCCKNCAKSKNCGTKEMMEASGAFTSISSCDKWEGE